MAKRKKRRLKGRSFFVLFVFLLILCIIGYFIYNVDIKNIIVKGNSIYSDWDIIKLAGLSDYPSSIDNSSLKIEKRLVKSPYIAKASVKKVLFTKVIISVKENKPLFFYVPNNKTVLYDGSETEDTFSVPTLLNYVPDKVYKKFLSKLRTVDYNLVLRISEIQYDPNEVDTERFLLSMNDGNYVYITLSKFDKFDDYLNIIKQFDNKKGILYLDSGEYFKVTG